MYLIVSLLGICDGLCWTLYVFPVRSCPFPEFSMHSHLFSMHLNWPLLGIICLFYDIKLDFVVYSPILCVLNAINSKSSTHVPSAVVLAAVIFFVLLLQRLFE